MQALILSVATVRGDKGVTVDDVTRLCNQAECHLMMAASIRLAVQGKLHVDLVNGELTIIHPLRVAEAQN